MSVKKRYYQYHFAGFFSDREGLSISGKLSELIILRVHRLTTQYAMLTLHAKDSPSLYEKGLRCG